MRHHLNTEPRTSAYDDPWGPTICLVTLPAIRFEDSRSVVNYAVQIPKRKIENPRLTSPCLPNWPSLPAETTEVVPASALHMLLLFM